MKIALALLALIPELIKIIIAVEAAFPQSGVGTDKLNLVKTILQESYSSITELWPSIEKIVAAVVAFANKIGAFTK